LPADGLENTPGDQIHQIGERIECEIDAFQMDGYFVNVQPFQRA
jgi:hypothetical protein